MSTFLIAKKSFKLNSKLGWYNSIIIKYYIYQNDYLKLLEQNYLA
jgi:hypothetical protein